MARRLGRIQPTSARAGEGNEIWPSWSPDGSTIAFTVNGTLAVVDVDEGSVTNLEVDSDVIGDAEKEFTSWSATGRIAFVTRGDIWSVQADGSNPIRVGGTGGRNLMPTWSPDSQLLAFIGSRWER